MKNPMVSGEFEREIFCFLLLLPLLEIVEMGFGMGLRRFTRFQRGLERWIVFRSGKIRRFVKIGKMGWAWNAEDLKRGCVVFRYGYGYIKKLKSFILILSTTAGVLNKKSR